MIRNGTARRIGRSVWRTLLGICGLGLAYWLAGTIGSMIPVHRDWRPPAQGIRIYIADNGVHTDLILPMVTPEMDWRPLLRPEHLRDPREAARTHVAIGWGDRDFYLNTPHWSDVDPLRVAKAMVGLGSTVLHVAHVDEPVPEPMIRPILLRPEEYRRLVIFLRSTFTNGSVVPGYGNYDSFYSARGGYSAFRTCNEWTAEALRAAGVKTGAWTPFASGVIRWV